MMMHRSRFRPILAALTAAVLFLLAIPLAAARGSGSGGSGGGSDDGGSSGSGGGGSDKQLVLRVNSAVGVPGGVVAVVVRTYAPRPVRQGQVLMRVARRAAPPKALGLSFTDLTQPLRPFVSLLSAVVYSQRNDASNQALLQGQVDGQMAKALFQSPSGTINASDGPMAVFKFRLNPGLQPGQTFDLTLDPALTGLTDAQGRPITVKPRNGVLTIRAR